ncbi:MAG: hypothetical protein ACLFMU_09015 [Bacteroidales bacterium]
MKTSEKSCVLFVALLLCVNGVLKAQQESFRSDHRRIVVENNASTEIQNLYPEAMEAIVYYGGRQVSRELNYNLLFDIFYYEDNRKGFRLLDNPHEIDSIRIEAQTYTYVPDHGFFEVVEAEPLLLRKYAIDISPEVVVEGAYGSNVHASSVEVVMNFEGAGAGGSVDPTILVHNPGGERIEVTLNRQSQYHIMKDKVPVNVRTRSLLLKNFADDRRELRRFVRRNDIDFEEDQDMVTLAGFVYSLTQ